MAKNLLNKKLQVFLKLQRCLVYIAFLLPFISYSQSSSSSFSKRPIKAEFIFHEVEYNEMAVISNVLKLKNVSTKNYAISVNLNMPNGWRSLNNPNKEYTLAPNDSIFLPVRLLTSNKSAKGGTKYNITAFVYTIEGTQIALAGFMAGRPKKTDWQMHVIPKPRIYFLNGETSAPFQINLSNNGDEDQEIILSMNKIGKDILVADTTGKILRKNYMDYTLAPFSDTLLPFKVMIDKPERNIRRIDSYGYKLNDLGEEKHYGIFLKATETGVKPAANISKTSRADFIKLANNINFVKLNDVTRMNQYGSAVIPVTMQANINNVLGQQPIMNLIFNGNTQLDKNSQLDYFLQTGFTYYKFDNQTVSNINSALTYTDQKSFLTVGSGVALNMNVSGLANGSGLAGSYRFTPNQTIGGYYIRNGLSFANYQSVSMGTAYAVDFNKVKFGLAYGRKDDKIGNYLDALNGNVTYQLSRHQSIGFRGQYTVYNFGGYIFNSKNYGGNYSANYSTGKGLVIFVYNYQESVSNLGGGILNRNKLKNISSNLTNSYRFNRGSTLSLQNNFMLLENPISYNPMIIQKNFLISNVLSLQLPPDNFNVNYIPSVYFNYSNYFTEKMISYGLHFNANTYNPLENLRMGFSIKGGYNKLINYPELGTFFNAQSNALLRYRTFNLNVRYAYGPIGQGNIVYLLTNQKVYPQTIAASLGNQYQFKSTHFIWENTFNYGYMNVNQRHNIGLYSQLFYFTKNGWRFDMNISYYYTISQSYTYIFNPGTVNNFTLEPSDTKIENVSFQLGFGVKKDFGIPLPEKFRKTHFSNVNFKAFLDINGNRKFDIDEVPLENIVIRMNDYEVLSNENGEASFLNTGVGKYKLQVFPLVDVGAWFPVVSDSINVVGANVIPIPFSKGVQILGNVTIDREKFSAGMTDKLDISRIKIFLVDSLGQVLTSITDNRGNFKFYVPYGNYTLKFDEKILGSSFELAQNDIPIELGNGMESYYHTFFIIEKKRRVKNKKFGPDGSVIITEGEAGSLSGEKDRKPDVENGPSNKTSPAVIDSLKNKELNDKFNPENPLYNPQAKDKPVSPTSNQVYYYAQEGNTLKDIADAYDMTLDEIKEVNKLKTNDVSPGQGLKVNKIVKSADINYELTTTTIQPGEDLYKLYKRAGMTVEEIVRINKLKSDKIAPGQVLKVKKF